MFRASILVEEAIGVFFVATRGACVLRGRETRGLLWTSPLVEEAIGVFFAATRGARVLRGRETDAAAFCVVGIRNVDDAGFAFFAEGNGREKSGFFSELIGFTEAVWIAGGIFVFATDARLMAETQFAVVSAINRRKQASFSARRIETL